MKKTFLAWLAALVILSSCSDKAGTEDKRLTFEDIEEEFNFDTFLTDYSREVILERFGSVENYQAHLERFEANKNSSIDVGVVNSNRLKGGPTYGVELIIPSDNNNVTGIWVDDDECILWAAWAYGIDLPYSCIAGACSTCASKIIEGHVDATEGSFISLDEYHEGGWFSLCIAYPLSDCKILTEQEEEYFNWEY
ncbi:MAG: 2Fe-2S iron-sulfur cluster binding domain-containing protein [Marinifilaceae bacterium]|nr:2Fe-2S iron-sulfur cluster binding domain-containing protein [Marinifilaceae bacterium]